MKPTLSTEELQRVIVRTGGLWSASELAQFGGPGAKKWPHREGFPDPSWRTGRTYLYAGWHVWQWCEDNGHHSAADYLYHAMIALRTKRRL